MLVSAFIWSRMEIFFLERYWGVHEVAMFTVGLTFAVMVQQAASLFSGAFMAHFSGLVGSDNHTLIQYHYETATKLAALVVIPLAFGGAAIMPALLPLLFGVEFQPAVPNAMVLTASAALAFSTIGSSLVYAKERSGFIAIGGFAGAILSVTAGFLIVSRFGAWGAVWSRLFVQGSMIALGTWFIITRLHFSYPFKRLGGTVIAAVFCGLSAWWAINVIPNPYVSLFIAVPLGVIVYMLGIKCFRVLGLEELRHLERIVVRLPIRLYRPLHSIINAMANTK
jgi:O-antigen/teichoic acid export membrane protein